MRATTVHRSIRMIMGMTVGTILMGTTGVGLFSQAMVHHHIHTEQRGKTAPPPHAAVPAPSPHHDPNAYYPSEHPAEPTGVGLNTWTALAAGGAGLAVLTGCLGVFMLFGGFRSPDDTSEAA